MDGRGTGSAQMAQSEVLQQLSSPKAKTHESKKTTDDLMAEEEADGKFKHSHGRNKKGSVGREMARAGGVEAKD